MTKEVADIRDQLGKNPEVFQVLNANWSETLGLEQGTSIISRKYIGHSFILGHATNGKLGIGYNGVDGEQIVLGEAGRTETFYAIVNPNQTYHEHFRDTDFKSTTEPNTADWNTASFRIGMSTSSSHATVYNTVATSSLISYNDGTILNVTVNCTETKYGNDLIKYYVRTSTGVDWEECTLNQSKALNNTGTSLYFRILFLGNGGSSTYIEDLDISYGG